MVIVLMDSLSSKFLAIRKSAGYHIPMLIYQKILIVIFLLSCVLGVTFCESNKTNDQIPDDKNSIRKGFFDDQKHISKSKKLIKDRREKYLAGLLNSIKKELASGLYTENQIYHFFDLYRYQNSQHFKMRSAKDVPIVMVAAHIKDVLYLLFPVNSSIKNKAWIWDFSNSKFHKITEDITVTKTPDQFIHEVPSKTNYTTKDKPVEALPPTSEMVEVYRELINRPEGLWNKDLLERSKRLNEVGKFKFAMETASRATHLYNFKTSSTSWQRSDVQWKAHIFAALMAAKQGLADKIWEFVDSLPVPLAFALPEIRSEKSLIALLTTNRKFRSQAIIRSHTYSFNKYIDPDKPYLNFPEKSRNAQIEYNTTIIGCDVDDSCESIKEQKTDLILKIGDSWELIIARGVTAPNELNYSHPPENIPVNHVQFMGKRLFIAFSGKAYEVNISNRTLDNLQDADSLFSDSGSPPLLITKYLGFSDNNHIWKLTYLNQNNTREHLCVTAVVANKDYAIDGFWSIRGNSSEKLYAFDSVTDLKIDVRKINCK